MAVSGKGHRYSQNLTARTCSYFIRTPAGVCRSIEFLGLRHPGGDCRKAFNLELDLILIGILSSRAKYGGK